MKLINNYEELRVYLSEEGVIIDHDDITVIKYKSSPKNFDDVEIDFPCMCILSLNDEGCRCDYYDLYIVNKVDFDK